jgi:hypothetical protein
MPAYFVQSHQMTIWEKRVSSWPALMTNEFVVLVFGFAGAISNGGLRPISAFC